MVPADKAANNVVVVCRLHYINTLKQELDGTRAYQETDTDEMSVVNAHLNKLPVKFSVFVNEGQDKLPTMYWLPKLHKRPYKAKFIANSSSCTTTELSKIYDKPDDFDFDIENFPFLDGDVPRRASYGVYISQLIRFARVCNHVADFNARNKCLTAKLLQQGHRYHKLRKTFSKFYRRHYELISKYNVG